MAAIAYLSDAKMLDFHRLHCHRDINFWRLSALVNFRDFKVGDLLFFYTKDKRYAQNEKGIVGFGRCHDFKVGSPTLMWKNYRFKNGFSKKSNFSDALCKITHKELPPKKISSIILTNVIFFQNPLYLSELKIDINPNVESFFYLEKKIVSAIFNYAKNNLDLWSSSKLLNDLKVEEDRYNLFLCQNEIGDFSCDKHLLTKAKRKANKIIKDNNDLAFIKESYLQLYKINNDNIAIYFIDIGVDKRLYYGQAYLLEKSFQKLSPKKLLFYLINNANEIVKLK